MHVESIPINMPHIIAEHTHPPVHISCVLQALRKTQQRSVGSILDWTERILTRSNIQERCEQLQAS